MQHNIDAIYENGVFRPLQCPDIPEGKKVRLTISVGSKFDQDLAKALGQVQADEMG